ncbi:unnamed protein product [Nezara viridula]|uniref:Uncharacterized protein n=1 Tax=Nezara viridula TaxID=85310 RepID=A0A9P0E8F8_NEZVI|nr:unnamed protein product [Nezara viridula]
MYPYRRDNGPLIRRANKERSDRQTWKLGREARRIRWLDHRLRTQSELAPAKVRYAPQHLPVTLALLSSAIYPNGF